MPKHFFYHGFIASKYFLNDYFILQIYSKESGDCERDNARHFVNTLLEFLPSILPLKYSIEIDDAIQRFASNYCQGNFVLSFMFEIFFKKNYLVINYLYNLIT